MSKDVGQGMDELMPHDNKDHCLYVIPYYINGKCKIKDNELKVQQNEPTWSNTLRAEYRIDKNLNLTFINTSNNIEFEDAESVLTIWLEFKTELLKK